MRAPPILLFGVLLPTGVGMAAAAATALYSRSFRITGRNPALNEDPHPTQESEPRDGQEVHRHLRLR
jgi:hypothetical protein